MKIGDNIKVVMIMDINNFYKSVLDADNAPIVICDLSYNVVYMNPASIDRYKVSIVGKSIFDCHNKHSNEKIKQIVEWFKESVDNNIVYTYNNVKESKDVYMVALRDDNKNLIGFYEKHQYRNKETMKLYDF